MKLIEHYFISKNRGIIKPSSRFNEWKETNPEEIKAFFVVIYNMGLIQHHSPQDYWATDEVISTPFVATVMKRNSFLLLLSFLHNNNEHYVKRGQDGYNPLYKPRPAYTNITTSFFENYYPTQNIAIAEGLVPWRGNLHF